MSNTKAELIEAARKLFASKGVDSTTMNEIAELSGKGRRTLYTYFKSKTDIYMAVLEQETNHIIEHTEEILNLPEILAQHIGKHIVVCIDEFQQAGDWADTLDVQKRMRGVWQHQKHVSYCLFGSRQHMMTNLFQNKRMPLYQFGELNYLQPIPTADWIPFIQGKFKEKGLFIDTQYVTRICEIVQNQSSYVQQLAWNVMLNTEKVVTDAEFEQGVEDLLIQSTPLFMEQTKALTTFQMNLLRAIIAGQHSGFASQEILEKFQLGTKSNVSKMQKTLIEKDFIELRQDGLFISDPVLQLWLQRQQKV